MVGARDTEQTATEMTINLLHSCPRNILIKETGDRQRNKIQCHRMVLGAMEKK